VVQGLYFLAPTTDLRPEVSEGLNARHQARTFHTLVHYGILCSDMALREWLITPIKALAGSFVFILKYPYPSSTVDAR
jgi:hypothetical protein